MTFLDITVKDTHTFYVVSDSGIKILMHNCDGKGHIYPLLLNFLYNWPELFESGIIHFVNSPLWIATKGTGKSRQVEYFYSTEEFQKKRDKLKGYDFRYIKGLGSLRDYEYQYAINNESKWERIEIDDPKWFAVMFDGKEIDARKNLLLTSQTI